jgi:hypothetical protein
MKKNIAQKLLGLIFLSVSTIAIADPIIEWAPFEVKSNVSDEKIIRAAQAVEVGFLAKQSGYIKRSLLKGSNNQWVDIVYWKSENEAQSAAAKAMESSICFEYFALMKQSEHSEVSNVQHYSIVKSWP